MTTSVLVTNNGPLDVIVGQASLRDNLPPGGKQLAPGESTTITVWEGICIDIREVKPA